MQPNYSKIAENCNLWRNYADISDSWDSVLGIIEHYAAIQDTIQPFAGPGHWNDPDMVSFCYTLTNIKAIVHIQW